MWWRAAAWLGQEAPYWEYTRAKGGEFHEGLRESARQKRKREAFRLPFFTFETVYVSELEQQPQGELAEAAFIVVAAISEVTQATLLAVDNYGTA
jgi:hypothetical protein